MAASPALAWEACAVSSCTEVRTTRCSLLLLLAIPGLSIWEKKEKKKKGFGEWGREEELPHGGFGEVEMPRRGRDSEVPTGVEGSWVPSELGIP